MAKSSRLPSFRKERDALDPERGPVLTPRFVIALVLMALGVAWIVFTYLGVRPDGGWGSINLETGETNPASGPSFMQDLEDWNYLIGFGLMFLGLFVSAHPSTPLGRGRGVVVGMLGCFLVGLVWICCYYIFLTGTDPADIPVFNDLGQKNLFVGIGFMAVGFAFATRWE
ncbi:cell division protein CrgA [Nocardioides sp. YIM 152588]|uniref:cell division protein CrgA n=1 Tax=Nocardioides sp. YIM 152588 TaxID=3158259 RepID=UPI0032E4DA8B